MSASAYLCRTRQGHDAGTFWFSFMECLNTRSPETDLQLSATRTSSRGVRLCQALVSTAGFTRMYTYDTTVDMFLIQLIVWYPFAFRETRGSFRASVDAKLQIAFARGACFPHHFVAAKLVARCHAAVPFTEATVSARGKDWLHSVVAVRFASCASAVAVG